MSWVKPPVWSPKGYDWPPVAPTDQPAPWSRKYVPVSVPEPNSVPPKIDHTRRIIDLETRIAALEAALANQPQKDEE